MRLSLDLGLGSVATLGGGLPVGTHYIPLPDPTLYSNPGKGIVGTGMVILGDDLANLDMYLVDGEGKATDAGPTDPRLWGIFKCKFNAYTNTITVEDFFPGSDIMAGLFEDTAAPEGPTAQPAVVSTDYSGQGLGYRAAADTLKLAAVLPGGTSRSWILEIDRYTGERVGQVRFGTAKVNHFDPINDAGLSPARGISATPTVFTVRNSDTLATIGANFTHGLTDMEMFDNDVGRSLVHASHDPNNISTFTMNTTSAALMALQGSIQLTGGEYVEAIRNRSGDALYSLHDPGYHAGGVNVLRIQRPSPLDALYP